MNIFEKLNILLTESKGETKVKESDIPIHPEMETKEQGEMAAAEKILKLFQKLKANSGGGTEEVKDSKPEIPDDIIDPMMKEAPNPSKDKTFEKNKLAGWDEKTEEKVKKEVDVDGGDEEDDEFDDFDYRKNPFGDEDNEDEIPESDDDRSEDEKLKDAIDDAIDSLNDEDDPDGDDPDDDDSGADWDDGEDGQDGGQQGQQQQGGQDGGQEGGQQGQQGQQQQGGQDGGQQGGDAQQNSQEGGGKETKDGGGKETQSAKQKRLEDLKKSLESKGMQDFNDKMEEIKNATETPEMDDIPGGQIETPSDEQFQKEMEQAGFDDETIKDMTKKKNIDGNEDYTEEEMEELKKQVVDGLEDACKKKGGSALASTIVKNAVKQKLHDAEWKEMLKVFLKSKSVGEGSMSASNKGIKWGHKNHLWRDAVLPADGPSKGTIQTIHCFVDFSGSVEQDLVYTFLGKVIDLCMELKYTKVKVYGFGERLTEPRIIDKKSLKDGADVALSQTWDFISSQRPGDATENFSAVAEEINKVKQKEKKAVFLIFGDAYWGDATVGPKCLKYEIMNTKYLDDICVLAYYRFDRDTYFMGFINVLRDIVGLKHIITTKASSIHK